MIDRKFFDKMPDGTEVELLTLRNGELSCGILTYGGTLQNLIVPDAKGNPTDVILGYDTIAGYMNNPGYLGALVGRYANRIDRAKFTMAGKEYPLYANDGVNHLHGGKVGFDKKIWTVESQTEDTVVLSLVSPDGEEGYPGTLKVQVTYRLTKDALELEYEAVSDKDTLCSMTNHAYFNLSGQNSGTHHDQLMQIFAEKYVPVVAGSIPTGELADVAGTPMDFRKPTPIGQNIFAEFEQLKLTSGYDHNWCIDGWDNTLRVASKTRSPKTGITMTTETTKPGIQFYAGNYMFEITSKGKGGADYATHWGFCLETQFYPDSPNQPTFPSAWLAAGEKYASKTVYRFSHEEI